MAERDQRERERDRLATERDAGQGNPDRAREVPSGAPALSSRRRLVLFSASALAAGVALAVLGLTILQPSPPGDTDLTDSAKAQRIATFQAHGVLTVPVVTDAERTIALEQMALPDIDRQALARDLVNGRTKLAWVTLWDDLEEDGDVVELSGAGFTRAVALTHVPQRFAIPLGNDGQFTVKGVRDGGGGITVSAEADGQPLPLPLMNPGEAVTVGFGAP